MNIGGSNVTLAIMMKESLYSMVIEFAIPYVKFFQQLIRIFP